MNLPDINFVEVDIEQMLADAQAIVESMLERELQPADPLMLFLKSFIAIIAQQQLLIDELARQNLLAYATGDNLAHIGALYGLTREPESYAKTTAQVKLSAPRQIATVIQKGTRINAGDEINFALDEDLIFLAGETDATIGATCLTAGEIGNGYAIGELDKIVDPQPFLLSIKNITESEGGADIESDDAFRERIHQAPESFSNAGSSGAYEYYAKKASTLISDVRVESLHAGEVDVYVLLEGGELPDTEMISLVYETLNAENVRPLTDRLFVYPAVVQKYEIEMRYWIARSQATQAAQIKKAVEAAVEEYVKWQRAKLGRDVNDTELYYRVRAAGAKRAVILNPQFIATSPKTVAIADNISVTYAGLEDD